MKDTLYSELNKLEDKYINVWEDICNIESPSRDKARVDAVGSYFIDKAKEQGWNIEVYEHDTFGNVVCITMNPNAPSEPISLSGHMDTVHPLGLFGSPATRVCRDENRIYGPGTMDCKGGIVAALYAMEALKNIGFTSRPIQLLLQSNEEIGSGIDNKDPINYICQRASSSVAFLNLEGHESYFEGKACLIRKGIAVFNFEISGVETHASYCAREGASAIAEAAHKIIELEKIKDENGLTFNCGVINGGSVSNTVPGKCRFVVDVRFSTLAQLDWAKDYIKKIADTVYVMGCSCTVTQTNQRPPMELCDRNVDLLNRANKIFEQNGLSRLEIGMRNGGSDAADVTCFGIPCIDSIGVGGERAHSPEEYGVLDSLKESATRIALIASNI